MNRFQLLIKAVNPVSLLIGVSSVIGGTAAATGFGRPNFLTALFCLIFAVSGQIAATLMGRYLGVKNNYPRNDTGVLEKYSFEPLAGVLKEGMEAFTLLAATAGLFLLAVSGWWTIVVAIMLAMLVYAVNVGSNPLTRNPFYLVVSFLIYGPIAVFGTAFTQESVNSNILMCLSNDGAEFMISGIMGLQAVNIHLICSLWENKMYKECPPHAFLVRFGKNVTMAFYIINSLVISALMAATPLVSPLAVTWWWFMLSGIVLCANLSIAVPALKKPAAWMERASIFIMLSISLIYLVVYLIEC